MTRLFYSDPLAAAWMAKHFGMKFQNQNNGAEITGQDIVEHAATGNTCRINIHPDSLSLLEPRVGDCGWFHTLGLARIVRVTADAIFTDVDGDRQRGQTHDSLFRIFMRLMPCQPYETPYGPLDRRHLEFMWPEIEP
jgi:hypothetical protein